MFAIRLIRQLKLQKTTRQFRSTAIVHENKPTAPNIKKEEISAAESDKIRDSVLGSKMHNVSDFDKRLLVWVKRYPSVDKVPSQVTQECILQARGKARVYASNYMMVFTVVVIFITVLSGKRDADRGDSIDKRRLEWHEQLRKEAAKEAAQSQNN